MSQATQRHPVRDVLGLLVLASQVAHQLFVEGESR